MRGKVPDRGVNRFQIGITPAYAGKSDLNGGIDQERERITPAYAGKSRFSCDTGICS